MSNFLGRDLLIRNTICKSIKPLIKMSVTEWAKRYRVLSQGNSAEPGKFKTSRAAYQNEPMDAFTQVGVRQVIMMCASQTGKSTIMENVIGRFSHLDPCPIMMIQPSLDMAQDFSKTRITPMIRDTKVLTNIYQDGEASKTRNGNNTILSKIFPGGRLIMCGANSPAGLASRPVRILLADEVDRFPDSAGGEGNPVDLAAKRMTTFWNAVMGLFSTPTAAGRQGGIEAKYLAGTQEEWQHACPNCETYHLLRWEQLEVVHEERTDKYGRKIFLVSSVKWRCPECGFSYTQEQMREAPQQYVAKNPDALQNGIRSFFVNCFASPWISWKDIALEYLEAKGDPTKEQVVVNTRFAESYQQRGAFDDETQFLKRREEYGAELPDGVLLLTAAVDTQDNRLEYEICGWGMDEESWGVSRGVILGRPDNAGTFAALDALLDKEYRFADGTALKVARTFIDSGGHYTGHIYKYCERNINKQRFAIKGQGGAGLPLNYKIAKASNSPIPLVLLGVDDGKQQVMNRLSISEPGAKYFHFPNEDRRGYDQLYFKGIISERKRTVKKGGQIREIWEPVKINGETVRNEPLDLRVYNLAAMQSLKPDWPRLYDAIHGTQTVVETEKKPPVRKKRRAAASFGGGEVW